MEFPQKPLKVGFIQKRGKDKPKWAPRYVVLKDQLFYYKKEKVNPSRSWFTLSSR